jgi:hypothetical protein
LNGPGSTNKGTVRQPKDTVGFRKESIFLQDLCTRVPGLKDLQDPEMVHEHSLMIDPLSNVEQNPSSRSPSPGSDFLSITHKKLI